MAARYFDRDPETNQVLWFSGPPVDMAHSRPPQHTLAYLDFLATKKRKAGESVVLNGNGSEHESKRQRVAPISQRAKEVWEKMQQEGTLPSLTT